MTPIYPTMWQWYPASRRDLLDYLVSLRLTADQFARGSRYLDPPMSTPRPKFKFCTVENCMKPFHAREMCHQHYDKWKNERKRANRSD